MTRSSTPLRAILAGALALVLVTACAPAAGPQRVEITFRYSHFSPAVVEVPRGVPVTLVLRNDDPIDHEWIVGTEEVHARHRAGTEPTHDEIATEVTVAAKSERATTVTFAKAGTYTFICHLPRHEAYGMVGKIVVR